MALTQDTKPKMKNSVPMIPIEIQVSLGLRESARTAVAALGIGFWVKWKINARFFQPQRKPSSWITPGSADFITSFIGFLKYQILFQDNNRIQPNPRKVRMKSSGRGRFRMPDDSEGLKPGVAY